MAKQTKKSTTVASKEAMAVNVANTVYKVFGKPTQKTRETLASLAKCNKVSLTMAYHVLCALAGMSPALARQRIHALTLCCEKKSGEFTAEAVRFAKDGSPTVANGASYSQSTHVGFAYDSAKVTSGKNWKAIPLVCELLTGGTLRELFNTTMQADKDIRKVAKVVSKVACDKAVKEILARHAA